jgi:CheY-like chemotaxis protein
MLAHAIEIDCDQFCRCVRQALLRVRHGMIDFDRAAAVRLNVFTTAKGRDADIVRYRRLGVKGVILKPFDPITLSQQLWNLLAPVGS